eukprot:gene759-biopygen779
MCSLMAANFVPLVPHSAIRSPVSFLFRKSKWTSATTPIDLSLFDPPPPVHPVVYSPVPTSSAFGNGAVIDSSSSLISEW